MEEPTEDSQAMLDRQVLPKELWPTLKRLDDLLAETDDVSRQRAGMGIRLALGMAQELRDGLPLGTDTAALVAAWVEKYGKESVDAAVAIARDFLVKPDEMRRALAVRLGMGTGAAAAAHANADADADTIGGADVDDGSVPDTGDFRPEDA